MEDDGISKQTDLQLKLKCLEIAAKEQLDYNGVISNEKVIYDRAKALYNEAHKQRFFQWKSVYSDGSMSDKKKKVKTEKPKKTEKKAPTVNVKLTEDGLMKICPKCGEKVHKDWPEHKFKKDGSKCGFKF